jgi:hypothetical protein
VAWLRNVQQESARESRRVRNNGYHACPCRDCFEIAIGCDEDGTPDLCHECETAGCDRIGAHECRCEIGEIVDEIDDPVSHSPADCDGTCVRHTNMRAGKQVSS